MFCRNGVNISIINLKSASHQQRHKQQDNLLPLQPSSEFKSFSPSSKNSVPPHATITITINKVTANNMLHIEFVVAQNLYKLDLSINYRLIKMAYQSCKLEYRQSFMGRQKATGSAHQNLIVGNHRDSHKKMPIQYIWCIYKFKNDPSIILPECWFKILETRHNFIIATLKFLYNLSSRQW